MLVLVLPILLGLLESSSSAGVATQPPLPFLDWDACPFECCTYRKWTANAPVRILKERRHGAALAFSVKRGEDVLGLTGVVVTTRAGEARVFRAIELGKERLKALPGDVVYILHYEGEGSWKFWFKGNTDSSDGFPDIGDKTPDSELDLRIVSQPKTIWWVKVKNEKGQVGWTDQPARFDHLDACE